MSKKTKIRRRNYQAAQETPPDREVRKRARLVSILAAEVYAAVEAGGFADRELSRRLRGRRDIIPPDKGFLSALIFSLCRWRGWTGVYKDDWERFMLLSWFLDATVPHPIAKAWAIKVGIKWQKVRENMTASTSFYDKARLLEDLTGKGPYKPQSLVPAWFFQKIPNPKVWGYGPRASESLIGDLQKPAELWVRIQGVDPEKVVAALSKDGHEVTRHSFLKTAIKLKAFRSVRRIPSFESGDIEVQDISSQGIGLVCAPGSSESWLDVCAGSGGKTLHLASLKKGKGSILGMDISKHKLRDLRDRAKRSRFNNIRTRIWTEGHAPAKAESFNGVLVDAPCSSSGTWRRNPEARWRTTPAEIKRLSKLQLEILNSAAPAVRLGGVLVYSTCSIFKDENDGVVDKFLAAHPEFKLEAIPHPLNGKPTDGRIWFSPKVGDGMYAARMRRRNP